MLQAVPPRGAGGDCAASSRESFRVRAGGDGAGGEDAAAAGWAAGRVRDSVSSAHVQRGEEDRLSGRTARLVVYREVQSAGAMIRERLAFLVIGRIHGSPDFAIIQA